MSADRRGRSGRRRNPLIGDGPVVDLAQALRDVVDGRNLTGEQVYQQTFIAESTQSKALGGKQVPTWPTTWELARLDPAADEVSWATLWAAANATKGVESASSPEAVPAHAEPGSELPHKATDDAATDTSELPDRRALPRHTPAPSPADRPATSHIHNPKPRPTRLVGALIAVLGAGAVLAFMALATAPAVAAVVATIPVSGGVGDIAVSPDGRVYAVNLLGANLVSVIDTRSNTMTATIPVGDSPTAIAVASNDRAYVTNSGADSVSVINTRSNTTTATVPVGDGPTAVAVSPDGAAAYIMNADDSSISVIDTGSNTVTATIRVVSPTGIAVSPDGHRIYVLTSSTVEVIDTRSLTKIASIYVSYGSTSIAVSPDGRRVYVPDYYEDSVSVIDTSTNSIIHKVPAGDHLFAPIDDLLFDIATDRPADVAASPDGNRVYVLNSHAYEVSVIDTRSNTVIALIPVSDAFLADALAVSLDGRRVYVSSGPRNTVTVIDTDRV